MSKFAATALVAASCALVATATTVTVTPASPRSLDTVRVQVPSFGSFPYALDKTRVTMSDGRIQIVMVSGAAASAVPAGTTDVMLGDLPEGNYHVDILLKDTDPFIPLASLDFVVAPAAAEIPSRNLTDLWWIPSESGWGVNVVQHASGKLFATWFVYGADSRPVWYVMPDGAWTDGSGFRGDVYRTSGPMLQSTFDPRAVQRTKVGQAVFYHQAFVSTGEALEDGLYLSWTVDGQSYSRTLRRQSF